MESTSSTIRSLAPNTIETSVNDVTVYLRAYVTQSGEKRVLWKIGELTGSQGVFFEIQSKVETEHTGKYQSVRLREDVVETLTDEFAYLEDNPQSVNIDVNTATVEGMLTESVSRSTDDSDVRDTLERAVVNATSLSNEISLDDTSTETRITEFLNNPFESPDSEGDEREEGGDETSGEDETEIVGDTESSDERDEGVDESSVGGLVEDTVETTTSEDGVDADEFGSVQSVVGVSEGSFVVPEWFEENLGTRFHSFSNPHPSTQDPPYPYESVGVSEVLEAFELYRSDESDLDDDDVERVRESKSKWERLVEFRPRIKSYRTAALIPFSLVLYAVVLGLSSVTLDAESVLYTALSTPSRIGDLVLLNIVVIAGLLGVYVSGHRVVREREVSPVVSYYAGEVARTGVVILQLIPLVAFSVIVFTPVSSVEYSAVHEWFWSTIGGLREVLPGFVVSVGELYYSVSVTGIAGLSVYELVPVMVVAGLSMMSPFVYRYIQAVSYAWISTPYEIPKLLPESDGDFEVSEYNPDPKEYVEFEGEYAGFDTSVIDDVYEIDSSVMLSGEELVEIPDSMRIEPYTGYTETIRYWVERPNSYVSILYNSEQSDYRYFVVEPQLHTDEQNLLLTEFKDRLETSLLFKDIDDSLSDYESRERKIEIIEREIKDLSKKYNIQSTEETYHKLMYYIRRDLIDYGPTNTMMMDQDVEDISCDGENQPLFVFHRHYNDLMSNVAFEKEELRQYIIQLAQRSGEHISASRPLVDASLPTGDRIQMSLGDEVTTKGSTFTIRIFQDTPFTPVHLIETNTFSLEQMAYLWQAIQYDKSLIFAGGTASGKTTSMNAISLFIPPKSKVVTIEDTREISLPHKNWIPGVTREGFGGIGDMEGQGSISMFNLLTSALRQRPEYMIVGEIRGEEAETLFQAMSTGHTTYSTMHADSVDRAVGRLTNPPINVPREMVESLDIMCIQNQVRIQDEETGDVENVRRNESIKEIVSINPELQTKEPFFRDAEQDVFQSSLDNSQVIDSIREEQGMTRDEVNQDLQNRMTVLKYLVDNDIKDVDDVTRTIQAYMLNPRRVTEAAESGSLDPNDYEDITDISFTDSTTELLTTAEKDIMKARELPEPEQDLSKQSW